METLVTPGYSRKFSKGIKNKFLCLILLWVLSDQGKQLRNSQHNKFTDYLSAHLDAAYNLARWIIPDAQDAEDVLQDACLRAYKGFDDYRGGGRAWLLTIVRNTAYNYLRDRRPVEQVSLESILELPSSWSDPELVHIREADAKELQRAIEALQPEYREVIILKEMDNLSYKEIAQIQEVPIGTVMSRLARARSILRKQFQNAEEHI